MNPKGQYHCPDWEVVCPFFIKEETTMDKEITTEMFTNWNGSDSMNVEALTDLVVELLNSTEEQMDDLRRSVIEYE
ncbi:hypothetical protein KUL42_39340 [Alteromonas sp. KUL42]|uniref:hypothetical protein n=1 Tax=Alteromonas sp. KUL42 TaxID=2480797 RepID=UPI001035783B|nr:hypothetical protein [Alteromonas sp. KUL42]TAP31737.1 hypothetical protein EYR97_19820 [Alteromonas sp. KUL42]GEA09173.1 hypothetical protein KUL42_39340 [Alteromonas sp. KUL42]